VPLTDTAVRKTKSGDKPIELFDARGLYLQVNPAGAIGGALSTRTPVKKKLLSLGIYPDVTIK
jgi:hypothetical protein